MKNYKTRDFYLAAFLFFSKCKLESTEVEDRITVFAFEKTDKLNGLVAEYYNLKGKVEPMAYGQSVRALKSIIWASKTYTNSNMESDQNVKQTKGSYM